MGISIHSCVVDSSPSPLFENSGVYTSVKVFILNSYETFAIKELSTILYVEIMSLKVLFTRLVSNVNNLPSNLTDFTCVKEFSKLASKSYS